MTVRRFPRPGEGPVVVVGGGTAGCVVAGRLADAGHQVVLVEAGSGSLAASDPLLASLDHRALHGHPDRWWPDLTVVRRPDTPPVPYAAGRGLGGSSAVNGMLADVDLDDPALLGRSAAATALRRVRLSRRSPDPEMVGPLARGLLEAGVGRQVELATIDGRRSEAGGSYLGSLVDAGSLRVVDRSVVRRIDASEEAAAVVLDGEARIDGAAVVVCAGAIQTPALLLRSGLGNDAVGTHLQDHPAVEVRLRSIRRATRSEGGTPVPVTTVIAEHDGVRLVPFEHVVDDSPHDAAVLVMLMRPRTTAGSVTLDPVDPAGPPSVRFGSLGERDDAERLAAGVAAALRLLDRPPFVDLVDVLDVRPDGPVFHASSSCGIGRCLAPDGRVLGTSRVFVADTSAFPGIPRTGTMLPTLVQAERLVDEWLRGTMSS